MHFAKPALSAPQRIRRDSMKPGGDAAIGLLSKPKIAVRLLEYAAALLEKFEISKCAVVAPAGRRLEMAAAISNKMTTSLPLMRSFTVPLNNGPAQNHRRKPSYLQMAASPELADAGQVPNYILSGMRARARECTFLRCTDRDCPLRTAEEKEALTIRETKLKEGEEVPVQFEIDPDDTDDD